MLKWTLRLTITVIDLVLLTLLWWVAEWPSPLTWLMCDGSHVIARVEEEVNTDEVDIVLQASGAWDEDMSGD